MRASDLPEVSVLLPVRDGAATLDAALASVLASRGPKIEVVCVDDGSRDGTPNVLARWESRAAGRLRCLHTEPRGIVHALNVGLAACRADVVARMDADDEIYPDRLAHQLAALRTEPATVLMGCQVESFRAPADGELQAGYRAYTEWVNGLLDHAAMAREAFVECPIPHPTWMFRRDQVLALGGYRDGDVPEDLDLVYRALLAGGRLGKVPAVLHRWRDHPRRLSRIDPRYGKRAFTALKAAYLGRLHPMTGAVIWGAGPTGRRLARALAAHGVRVRALIDVDPRRVGRSWRGLPIHAVESIGDLAPAWRDAGWRILGAVASRGGREEIRARLLAIGLTEGSDFVMTA